ncbi:MAG: hypothetical protein L0Z50_17365 [Verrucomicrobiales bacterium]|nr:hypothetical protein [Verrucomicrobiales bacterium]
MDAFTFGPDGSIYTVNRFQATPGGLTFQGVRRIGPDGVITSVIGVTKGCDLFTSLTCGDGGPALEAGVSFSLALTVGPDGTLYVNEGNRIRRVRTDGIIEAFAGLPGMAGFSGDGGPPTNALLSAPFGFAVDVDGSVFVADRDNNRIRRIGPDGFITTIAGLGTSDPEGDPSKTGDGGPALQARLVKPSRLALAPDGSLLVVAGDFSAGFSIRRIGPLLPGISDTDSLIASADGAELYVFDRTGRHLRTLEALTGSTLFEFDYTEDGQLAKVIQKTGGTDNVTTIEHDAAGNPTAIIGPYGQRTTLGVDANGFLARFSNPADEQAQFTSTSGGLLTSLTDPRGKTSTFTFDPTGRLIRDADPVGGTQDLVQVVTTNSFTVVRTTALGRATTNKVEHLDGKIQRRTTSSPDGTQVQSEEAIDAATARTTSSNGMISERTLGPDARFGMQAPVLASLSLRFPSGLEFKTASTRSAVLNDPDNPLTLVRLTQTDTVNGRTGLSTYTAATRTIVNETPQGRKETYSLDPLGRFAGAQLGNLHAVNMEYDDRARLASLSVGSGLDARTFLFSYNAQGFLETVTDPIGRTEHLAYDAAGRIASKRLPGGGVVSFGYGTGGNLTSIMPPGRPAHSFGYSDRNELALITPPNPPGTGPTTTAYDLDGAITNITRAGVQRIAISYDAAGRPGTRTLTSDGKPSTTDAFSYDSAGRITNAVAGSGVSIGYTYDGASPVAETWSGSIAGSVARTYNDTMRLASQSINGAHAIPFGYENDGFLTNAGSLVITRDPQHALPINSTLGVVTIDVTYNGFGELTNYAARASRNPVYDRNVVRDALGRIVQKVETVEDVASTYIYGYDVTGQLTNVLRNGRAAERYSYDANGNRTNATVGGIAIEATYDNQDRLTSYGRTTYIYNAAGDLESKNDDGQITRYQYDALGNLLGVTLPDATAITYLADARGRRVGKRVNGTLVQGLLYSDALRPVAELDGAGMVVSRFVYIGGVVPTYFIKGGVAFHLIRDEIGSIRLVVNTETGAIVQRLDYDSFGNVLTDTNPGFQPFGFAGGLYDPDTKLVRFTKRDYDAEAGRWMAKDPVGFAGGDFNLYRYVRNDPVNFSDPLGLGGAEAIAEIQKEIEFLEEALANLAKRVRPTVIVEGAPAIVEADAETRALVKVYESRLSQLKTILRVFPPSASALISKLGAVGAIFGTGQDFANLANLGLGDCPEFFHEYLRILGRRTGTFLPVAMNIRLADAFLSGEIHNAGDFFDIYLPYVNPF